jgi:hypothetical protein
MQVKFNDGTTLEVLAVNGKSVYVQGTQRDALEIQMAKDTTTVDALDALTADNAKTGKITITDDSGTYVHDNYSIRAELAIKPVITAQATSTTSEVTEDRLCVTLAQLTYSEVQMAAQQAQIDAQTQAIAELSVLIAGGNA